MNAKELKMLVREINGASETIQLLGVQLKDKASEFMSEVLLQGQRFLKAKEARHHGEWLPWLKDNCAESESTTQIYMRLAANPERHGDFIASGSIRKALSLLEDKVAEPHRETRRWPAYMEAIGRASKFIGYVERFPFDSWPDEGIEKLRDQMLPVAEKLWPERFQGAAPPPGKESIGGADVKNR